MARIRILLIEDDPDIIDLVYATLESKYECLKALNGLEGLQLAMAGEPDLIVCDIMMPVMDGHEFIRRLRNIPAFESTPIIYLSALGTRDQIREGYELGASLYLTKPIDPSRLRRNVDLFIEDHGVEAVTKPRTVEEVQEIVAGAAAAASTREPESGAEEVGEGKVEAVDRAADRLKGEAEAAETHKEKTEDQIPRVLLVEDDPDTVELVRAGIGEQFELDVAVDGMEGIERAARYAPDIFVIDALLPKMAGYQLVGLLKKNNVFSSHPIVLVSAKSSARDRQYVKRLGIDYFLAKPFEVAELNAMLSTITSEPGFVVCKERISREQMELETLRDYETSRRGPAPGGRR